MIRLFIISIIAAFAFSCSTHPPKTTVSISLLNENIDQAEMIIVENFINMERETLKVSANEEGKFIFDVYLQHPQIVYLAMGSRRMELYLDQGGTLEISADMNNWEESLAFNGRYANENAFLVRYNREVEQAYGQNRLFGMMSELSPDDFIGFMNEKEDAWSALISDFTSDKTLDRKFLDFFRINMHYSAYTLHIYYPMYYEYFSEETADLPEGYYDFIQDALQFDDHYFNVRDFTQFLNEYTNFYISSNPDSFGEDTDRFANQIWVAENVLEGKARYFVKANAINASLNWGDFAAAEAAFFDYRDNSPYSQFIDALETSYHDALRVAPGNQAPSFTLTDIHGSQVSLSDFEGQVVYLDFWASWCGPCMREVPYAKKLKERFADTNDLVFLYISVDEDLNAWRNTVEAQNIQGVHLNVRGMRHEVAELYNVKGVPSFFIIDRNGVIYDNNPGRPSSGEVIDEQLRSALGA